MVTSCRTVSQNNGPSTIPYKALHFKIYNSRALPIYHLCTILRLLERVFHTIVLPQPHLLPLLRRLVLHKNLLGMRRQKLPNESRIP